MDKAIHFTVNGQPRSVTCDPIRPLLEVLREDLKLTGTKRGCGEGQCRSCTVLIDGAATPSCNTPVGDIDGSEIVTIEGLASGDTLHPVQEAFIAARAMQCGFCTGGMIMEAVGLLNDEPHPTRERIISRMGDHICRCGTYLRILTAIQQAAGTEGGPQ